jgi:small subunit ribosomal protein S8
MRHDPLNDAILSIKNAERIGKSDVTIRGQSKLLVDVLTVFQKTGYIGEFEVTENQSGGSVKVGLMKQINDCGVVKPRSPVKHNEFFKWEKRFLPSRDFGVLVVSTPKGVLSHNDAKKQGVGGRLIAYIY